MKRATIWARIAGLLPIAILLLAALATAYPLREQTPIAHDHPVHMFKAWHMWNELLPSLRIRGFSHFWSFGFPSDEFVPPGEELWVSLIRVVTLGKLSWPRTYACAMGALFAVVALSGYRFTRQYFGVIAGVLAGLLMLWDPGGWCQGGWGWMMDVGAWPVSLGVASLLVAMASLEDLLKTGSARQLLITGLWIGVSYLSHQVIIAFLPILVLLLLLDHWWRGAGHPERRALVIAACALGVALSGFYLIPMMARAEQTGDQGLSGVTREEAARLLVDLRPFRGMWGGFVVLGFVGGYRALRRHLPGAFLMCAGAAIFFLLSTDLPTSFLHIERVMPSFRKLEPERMLLGAKLLWFPLVAHALAAPFEGCGRFWTRLREAPRATLVRSVLTRRNLAPAVVIALFLPFVGPSLAHFKATQIDKDVHPAPAEGDVDYWDDLQPLWAWTAGLRAASDEHYRIAYDLPRHYHLGTLAPVYDRTPIYKVGYTPTQTFWAFPMLADPRLYRLLSVKYVVTDHELDGRSFTFERDFGKLHVYRFNDFDPNPFTVIGQGAASLTELSPERIRIHLSDIGPDTRLKVHVSNTDHWQAKLNGAVVPILPATIFGAEYPFLMEIPAANGDLELRYVARAPDILGQILTWSALPLFFLGVWIARNRPTWLQVPTLSPALRTRLLVGAGAITLAIAGLFFVRWRGRQGLVAPDSVFRSVEDGAMSLGGFPCTKTGPFYWQCGGQTVRADVVLGQYGKSVCMTAPRGTPLRLDIKRPLGSFLVGRYSPSDGPGGIRVLVNQQEIGVVESRSKRLGQQFLQFDTRDHAAGEMAEIGIEIAGSPLACFDFRVVP